MMTSNLRALGFGLLAIGLMTASEQAISQVPNAALAPVDHSRNVLSYADTLERVLPSVVRIGSLDENAKGKLALAGIGSGAVIDAEKGYVITNAHVVANGKAFLINIPDGRIVKSRLIGMDVPTDIALLQADDLRVGAVRIADSDRVRVGDVVFAVGYPLGLEQSISLGIVSGLGRGGGSGNTLQNFIQTDAAINSGNSGGPLLDSQGRLVGVNTAILSKSGGSNGIGFSVPASLAIQVTDQLITHGEVKRGSLGIEMAAVSVKASEKVGINHWDGALVASVRQGSAAQTAGLQAGDVITTFGGRKVKKPNALRAWIGVATPGKPYALTYIRENGIENTIEVQITAFKAPIVESLEQLGVAVRPATEDDDIPKGVKGIYVSGVLENSPAERAGLQIGDVINTINNELANNRHVCDRLVTESKGRARLLVYRYGVPIPIIIES